MCVSCNFRIEEERQGDLTEPVSSHGILHTLVLATASPQTETTIEKERNQLEERAAAIRDLCAQLVEHERITAMRFQRPEVLLDRMFASIYGSDWSQLRLNSMLVVVLGILHIVNNSKPSLINMEPVGLTCGDHLPPTTSRRGRQKVIRTHKYIMRFPKTYLWPSDFL